MAETVGRPVYELEEEMPPHELDEWGDYFVAKAKLEHEAIEKARQNAPRRR